MDVVFVLLSPCFLGLLLFMKALSSCPTNSSLLPSFFFGRLNVTLLKIITLIWDVENTGSWSKQNKKEQQLGTKTYESATS